MAGPDLARHARQIMRRCAHAALGTRMRPPTPTETAPAETVLEPPPAGHPYVSFVLVGFDYDATPLLLLSDLADHSRNLVADPAISLLFADIEGRDQPLTGPRVILLGQLDRVDAGHSAEIGRLKARYMARHPSTTLFADFTDFALYRLRATHVHFIGGFARAHWLTAATVCGPQALPETENLASAEAALLIRLNQAIDIPTRAHMVRMLSPRPPGGPGSTGPGNNWQITGVDPEGCDLRCDGSIARLDFSARAHSADAVYAAVSGLAAKACQMLHDGKAPAGALSDDNGNAPT